MYEQSRKIVGDALATRVVVFDSLAEFTRPKEDRPKCMSIWKEDVMEHFKRSAERNISWFGASDFEEFERVMNYGDIKYLNMVEEKKVIVGHPKSLKRRRVFGDYGDELDIHKVNSGNVMNAWSRRSPRLRVAVKNIRLGVNISQSSSVHAEELQWVGVAALRLAEAFETAGYRVAIDGLIGAHRVSDKENIVMQFPLKSYESPLDTLSLTTAICFAGFFRGAGFMNVGLAAGTIRGSLGQPIGNEILKTYLLEFLGDSGETVEMVSNEVHSQGAAGKEIARIIEKYLDPEAEAA